MSTSFAGFALVALILGAAVVSVLALLARRAAARTTTPQPMSLRARTAVLCTILAAASAVITLVAPSLLLDERLYVNEYFRRAMTTQTAIACFAVGVSIVLCYLVAHDALRRGSANAAPWAIGTLVAPLPIGLLYLVLRPRGYLAECGSCRRDVLETLEKCPYCRAPLASPPAPAPKAMADFLATAPGATALDPGQTLAKGATLGPYRVLEQVGKGGMGAVYRAEHQMLGRTVALKVLPRTLASDAEFVERFKREAQVLAKLRHPNIVEAHDLGVSGDTYYFAMEFVEGTTLRSLLASKALTPDRALAMVPKLCDALETAHAQGVIHRDIKPENILIDAAGEPKIADFGLARIARGPTLTMTQAVMGTPDYMAPEQRESTKDVDHRADIYSLGVVLYEMLTGSLPIGRFEPPARRAPVDGRVDPIVLKALEYDRERRYARAAQMGTDIRRVTATGVQTSG